MNLDKDRLVERRPDTQKNGLGLGWSKGEKEVHT